MQPSGHDTQPNTPSSPCTQADTRDSRTVCVQLFAGAAQAVGAREVVVRLPAGGVTLAELSASVTAAYPQLQSLMPHSRWAIGNAFLEVEHIIAPEENRPIAMIPPVSGG